jgi:hypothetical protein
MDYSNSQWTVAAVPSPRPQGFSRKENVNPQQAAHPSKHDSEFTKFMKDVKAELGAFRALLVKLEALVTKTRKTEDRTDKPGRANAACVQDKLQAQKGVGAGPARVLPASYSSNTESEEEQEVHVASYAHLQAFDPVPTFHRVESILGPFFRVVQTARPTQGITTDYLSTGFLSKSVTRNLSLISV